MRRTLKIIPVRILFTLEHLDRIMECDENDYNYIEEVFCTPEIKDEDEANPTSNILSISEKSKHRYESMYEALEKWKAENKILQNLFSEEVLQWYIRDLSTKKSPSTLWCTYSMLKSVIKLKHNIDIGQYAELIAFLKDQSKGYTAVTAPVFTDEEITKFMNSAPDSVYLATKVRIHWIMPRVTSKVRAKINHFGYFSSTGCPDFRSIGRL